MTTHNGYERKVSWLFPAAGELWEVISCDNDWVEFEETRKNGQEDTHFSAVCCLKQGKWIIEPDDRDELIRDYGADTIEALEAFFNKHGAPHD